MKSEETKNWKKNYEKLKDKEASQGTGASPFFLWLFLRNFLWLNFIKKFDFIYRNLLFRGEVNCWNFVLDIKTSRFKSFSKVFNNIFGPKLFWWWANKLFDMVNFTISFSKLGSKGHFQVVLSFLELFGNGFGIDLCLKRLF